MQAHCWGRPGPTQMSGASDPALPQELSRHPNPLLRTPAVNTAHSPDEKVGAGNPPVNRPARGNGRATSRSLNASSKQRQVTCLEARQRRNAPLSAASRQALCGAHPQSLGAGTAIWLRMAVQRLTRTVSRLRTGAARGCGGGRSGGRVLRYTTWCHECNTLSDLDVALGEWSRGRPVRTGALV